MKLASQLKSRLKGFTLIELLIVITIIGILAVALIPRITGGPARARDVSRKADLNNIALALELYFSDNGSYPAGAASGVECLGASPGSGATAAVTNYLQGGTMPSDPSGLDVLTCSGASSGFYYYKSMPAVSGGGADSGYVLIANLENDDATGEGVYCDITSVGNDVDAALNALTTSNQCSSTSTSAYFVVSR